jgi:radical SAM superfamily enzyme YgiQ (UPF0313 family)
MRRGIPVIIGGIHASFVPKEAKKFCTSVVIGEAEGVWPKVLKDFENNKLKPFYKSGFIDISDIKAPRRDLYPKKYLIETVQTSRGCPFNCDYCSVTAFNGYKYRYRKISNVIKEIQGIKNKTLFIADDNIMGVGKKAEKRTLDLLKRLKPLNKNWIAQASVNICENDKVMKALADSGCFGLYIGFESLSTKFLKSVNKRINLKRVKQYEKYVKKAHDYGMHVIGSFMVGHDYDTKKSIAETTDFIIRNNFDIAFLITFIPYVGTRLYENMKRQGRLLYNKWWMHTPVADIVHKPKNMSPRELFNSIKENSLRLNSTKNNLKRYFKSIIATKNIFLSTVSCYNNFIARNHFKNKNFIKTSDSKSKEEYLLQRLKTRQ